MLTSITQIQRRTISSIDFLESPLLRRALELWRSKRGDQRLPSRKDLDPIEMPELLGKIALVDVEPEHNRLKYRLVGTEITNVTGRDVTGMSWDEVYPQDQGDLLREAMDHAIQIKEPVRSAGTMRWVEKEFINVEIIDLPLSTDGHTVDMIMRVVAFPKHRY